MKTILMYLIASIFITTICSGCNFIKERFLIKKQEPQKQIEQQAPQEEKKSEPIPVNPLHS